MKLRLNRSLTLLAPLALATTLTSTTLLAQPSAGGGRGGQGAQSNEQPAPGAGQGERRRRPGRAGGGPGGFMGRMEQMFDPSVTSDDIKTWKSRLKLTDDQSTTVEALFEAYQVQFAADAKAAREKVDALREEAREAQDPSMFEDIMKERQAFQKKRDEMEKSLFGDVKAVLNEQQLAEWPRIERDRRREQTLGNGLIAGERIDVAQLVSELNLTPEQLAPISPILDQYKDELDRELITRNQYYEQAQGRMRDFMRAAMTEDGGDNTELEKLIKDGREAGMRVRDVNRKFVRQIEPMLPDAQRTKFDDEVKRQSYPMVYRPTYAGRVLDAADKFEDLTADQRSALSGIRETYSRDLSALQVKMEKAVEDQQASFSLQSMRRGPFGMMDGAMGDLDRQRRELDDATADKIKALLTPEQASKLPERRGFGGGDGGNGDRPRMRDGGNDSAPGQQGDRPRRRQRQAPDQPA